MKSGLVAVLLAALATEAFAQTPNRDEELFGFELATWLTPVHGKIRAAAAGSPGTRLSVRNDLQIDDANDGVGTVSVWINPPTWDVRFTFSAYGGRFEEGFTPPSTFTFAGTTFGAGSVNARIITRAYSLFAEWEPPATRDWVEDLEITLLGGIHYTSHDLRMIEGAMEQSRSVRTISALLGARGVYTYYDQWQIEGLVDFIPPIEVGDREYRHFQVKAEFRWIFSDNFKMGLGYRLINLFGEDAANSPNVDMIDLQISGFYVTAQLIF